MARVGALLPCLAQTLCPNLPTVLSLTASSRTLRLAFGGDGAIIALMLAERKLVKSSALARCVGMLMDDNILRQAVVWARLSLHGLLDTLECLSAYICPPLHDKSPDVSKCAVNTLR